eukprot:scaffold8199_cov112-Isochrysis_galbana.AAC.1
MPSQGALGTCPRQVATCAGGWRPSADVLACAHTLAIAGHLAVGVLQRGGADQGGQGAGGPPVRRGGLPPAPGRPLCTWAVRAPRSCSPPAPALPPQPPQPCRATGRNRCSRRGRAAQRAVDRSGCGRSAWSHLFLLRREDCPLLRVWLPAVPCR